MVKMWIRRLLKMLMNSTLTNWFDKKPATKVELLSSVLVIPAYSRTPSNPPIDQGIITDGWIFTLPRAGFILTPLGNLNMVYGLAVELSVGVRRIIYRHPTRSNSAFITYPSYNNEQLPLVVKLWPLATDYINDYPEYKIPVSLVEDLSDFRSRDPVEYAGVHTTDAIILPP